MIIEFKTQKGISIIGYFPYQIAADAKIAIPSILDNISKKSETSINIIYEKSHSDPFEKMILDELTAARAEVGFTPHEIINEYRKNQSDKHNRYDEDKFFHVKWDFDDLFFRESMEVTLNTAIDNAQSQIVASDIDFFDVKAIDYIERLDVYMEDLERGEYNPIFESKNKFDSFNKVPKKMVYNNSRNQRVRYNRKILN